jgi:hypothetical protein
MLPPNPIGVAWMEPDGTIRMNLRAEGPGGTVGLGRLECAPSDKNYANILAHPAARSPASTSQYPLAEIAVRILNAYVADRVH